MDAEERETFEFAVTLTVNVKNANATKKFAHSQTLRGLKITPSNVRTVQCEPYQAKSHL
jgi:hypothetical protein